MAAGCATEAFSTTCAVHIRDCEGWWLSGCRSSVAEHWRLKPERCPGFDSRWLPAFFTFLYFRLVTSKFLYFQHEARCSERVSRGMTRIYHIHVHLTEQVVNISKYKCWHNRWFLKNKDGKDLSLAGASKHRSQPLQLDITTRLHVSGRNSLS